MAIIKFGDKVIGSIEYNKRGNSDDERMGNMIEHIHAVTNTMHSIYSLNERLGLGLIKEEDAYYEELLRRSPFIDTKYINSQNIHFEASGFAKTYLKDKQYSDWLEEEKIRIKKEERKEKAETGRKVFDYNARWITLGVPVFAVLIAGASLIFSIKAYHLSASKDSNNKKIDTIYIQKAPTISTPNKNSGNQPGNPLKRDSIK